MREKTLVEIRGREGLNGGKEDRRGGRLCEEFRVKEKERSSYQKSKEANGLKSRGTDGKGKVVSRDLNRGGGVKPNNTNQDVYLPAMVVPRTPVVPRNQDRTKDQGNKQF